jgi:Zn-dependent peptidase ImmA (M78 family)
MTITKKSKINLNPSVIKAFIESSGFSIEEVAQKSKIQKELLEKGEITIPQLKRLSEVLKRPLVAFFSDKVPELPRTIDYRLNRGKAISPQVFLAQRRLLYLLHKLKEMGVKNSIIPTFRSIKSPFELAKLFRNYLKIETIKNEKPRVALDKYKQVLEDKLKILIIEYPLRPLREKGLDDVRAFSVVYYGLAGIVLNEYDFPTVKLFSLFHEVCHILRRSSGICSMEYETEQKYKEESFCNKFAAEFLVPYDDIKNELEKLKGYDSDEHISEVVDSFSKIYAVSKQVILLRLLHLGILTDKKFSILIKKFKEEKLRKHGSANWKEKIRNRIGGLVLEVVRQAFEKNKLSFHEVIEIFDVKTKYAESFLKHNDETTNII